jgi:hypothetical protein
MSASASQGSSWLDVAVPIGPASTSGAQVSNNVSFNDGSFTFASSPNPGLTASLSNLSGGAASVGQGIGNFLTGISNGTSSLLPYLLIGGVALWFMSRHKH